MLNSLALPEFHCCYGQCDFTESLSVTAFNKAKMLLSLSTVVLVLLHPQHHCALLWWIEATVANRPYKVLISLHQPASAILAQLPGSNFNSFFFQHSSIFHSALVTNDSLCVQSTDPPKQFLVLNMPVSQLSPACPLA